jgi:hypothetical protein
MISRNFAQRLCARGGRAGASSPFPPALRPRRKIEEEAQ